jgi:Ala-tRNA(Pro) deacylase
MQTSDRNKLSQTVRFNSSTEIFWVFDKLDISYETTHHPPMFTVSDSKRLRESRDSDAYTKNLFLKNKKGDMSLVTCLEDSVVDLQWLGKKFNLGRLSFCSPERLIDCLGVTPGSVSPLSLINDTKLGVSFILEEKILEFKNICLHPLDNTQTTRISIANLIRFIEFTNHSANYISLNTYEKDHKE